MQVLQSGSCEHMPRVVKLFATIATVGRVFKILIISLSNFWP